MAACRPPIPPLLAVSVFFLSFFLQDPARAGGDPVLLLPPSLGVSVIFINTLIKMYAKVTLLTYAVTVKTQSIAPLRSTPDVELHSRAQVVLKFSPQRSPARSASLQLYTASTVLYSSTLYILSPPPSPLSWTPGPGRAGPLHLPTNILRAAQRQRPLGRPQRARRGARPPIGSERERRERVGECKSGASKREGEVTRRVTHICHIPHR